VEVDEGERRWIWGGMRSEREERNFEKVERESRRFLGMFGEPLSGRFRVAVLSREIR